MCVNLAEKLLITFMESISDKSFIGETISEEKNSEECPLCFGDIEDEKKLSICGHKYCGVCLKHSIISAIDLKEFPICCVTCGLAVGIKDLKGNTTPEEFQKMV